MDNAILRKVGKYVPHPRVIRHTKTLPVWDRARMARIPDSTPDSRQCVRNAMVIAFLLTFYLSVWDVWDVWDTLLDR